ncbi:MFS transporter [Metallosphaera hakonensis]|uniref:MFS transporter n=1 Tax=Metallosphaera hakonensis JCM 8857 = DSM 7519 TaxID=1293036 RepID=A0A2U9IT63_9CREN|nr:MFS transporter [Metallosphaera hakonensis]AWR99250.1 MFS transporter [Metallosphaera hakonensis JCM 8857 = DSM 7519]
MDVVDKVDKAVWTSTHSLLFASLGLGFFMWGTISTIAPLFYPSINNVFFIIVPIIATLAGNLVFPLISDKLYGRKKTFMITMSMYGIGAGVIATSAIISQVTGIPITSTPLLLTLTTGIVLGVLGVEGEVPVMLSYAAEMMPLKKRDQVLILAPNFDNVGAMIASAVVMVSFLFNNTTLELLSLSLTALAGLIFLIVVRLRLPESIRWLYNKGLREKAEKEVTKLGNRIQEVPENRDIRGLSLISRYWFLVAIAVSQYLTYGLMAFYIGDFYFPNLENLIVFVANVGASAAGFLAGLMIGKMKSRKFSLFSFVGGTVTILGILFTIDTVSKNMDLFYTLLLLNMAFSEFGWAVRTIYEPLILPTNNRAFLIGLVRVFPITLSSISVYFTSYLNSPFLYVAYNTALWAIGAVAALTWYFKGYDVNMTPVEVASQNKVDRIN